MLTIAEKPSAYFFSLFEPDLVRYILGYGQIFFTNSSDHSLTPRSMGSLGVSPVGEGAPHSLRRRGQGGNVSEKDPSG